MKEVIGSLVGAAKAAGVAISDLDMASVAQKALSAIYNPDGTGDEFFNYTTDADGNVTNVEYSRTTSSGFGKAEGVTNQDIVNGNAVAQINPETGQYEWTIPTKDPYTYNGNIVKYDAETKEPYIINPETNEREDLDLYIEGEFGPNNPPPSGGDNPYSPDSAPTLEDMSNPDSSAYDPGQFTQEVNDNNLTDDLNDDSGSWAGDAADWFLDALNNGATYLQQNEDSIPASEFVQNAYANGIRATAGIIESLNGLAVLLGDDPAATSVGEFAADLATIGEGANTEGYKEAADSMREFQDGLNRKDDPNTPIVYDDEGNYVSGDESKKSLWEGAQDIFKTAANHPAAFFGEYVSVEFMQEASPLLAGGLAAIAGKAVAKTLSKELTEELADKAAAAIGKKVGLTAAGATDVAESWGGTAGGAYEQAYDTFMKMARKEADLLELSGQARADFLKDKDIEGREYSLNLAINSGNVAGVMTLASMAAGGMALEKIFIGGKPPAEFAGLFNELARRMSEGATVVIKEGLTEALEEGAATAYTLSHLSLIDPDIDVYGDTGAAAAFGAIIGGTVSGSIYGIGSTGDIVSDLLIANNPDAIELLKNNEDYSKEELEAALNTFLGDPQAATDAMNFLYDEVYTSTAEATSALDALGVDYTPEDVTNNTGNTSDSDLNDEIAAYMQLTYGSEGDTDGDGIPNIQDNDPNNPDISGIEYNPETGDVTYTNEEGNVVVIDSSGVETIYTVDDEGNLTPVMPPRSREFQADPYINNEGYTVITNVDGTLTIVDSEGNVIPYYDGAYVEATTPTPTAYTPGDLVDPDGDGVYQLVGEDGETLTGAYNEDGTDYVDADDDNNNNNENTDDQALSNLENSILGKMKEYESQGLSRDAALQKAINDVASDLNTTKQEMLTALGTTETALISRFDQGLTDLGLNIDNVADFVGKPAQDVTQADIDIVLELISQQEALTASELDSFVFTDQQLQYDVNNDGVVDINDQIMLEQAFGGQDVSLGGQFAATGLYAYNDAIAAQQQIEAQRQFEEEQRLAQERQIAIQAQIDLNYRKGQFGDEVQRAAEIQAAQPTIATTNKMGLAEIGPAYNFRSIFRDQEQDQFYTTPFGSYNSGPFENREPDTRKATGGIIKDSTDRLLKIIGEE
jgi:hypothetical protein